MTARVRCAELATHPFGRDEVLAVPMGESRPTPLSRAQAAALRSCDRWLSATAHAQRLASTQGGSANTWHRQMARWTDQGLLDCLDEGVPLADSEAGGYDAVAVITRDRPDAVARIVADVVRATPMPLHVFDQSPDAGTQQQVHEAVRSIAPYAEVHSQDRVQAATRALAQHRGIDVATALSAVQPEADAFSGGANRNAMLLALRGQRVLCFDDDMRLAMASSPDAVDNVRITSQADPTAFWFPTGKAEVVRDGVLDTLAQHLGRLSHSLSPDREAAWWDDVHPSLFRKLSTARIAATSFGTLGDSGLGTNYAYLHLNGPSLARAASDAATWERLRTSRQLHRVADRVVLTPGPHIMGGAMGMDLRQSLPAFPPVGRGEDGVFGQLLALSNDVLFAHLPWAILHAPTPARRADPNAALAVPGRLPALDLLGLSLQGRRFPPSQTPADRLERLGSDIESVGSQSPAALRDAIAHLWWRRCGRIVADLQRQLDQPDTCRAWQRDVRAMLAATRSVAATPPTPEPNLKTARQRLQTYGRLLQVWPDLFSA